MRENTLSACPLCAERVPDRVEEELPWGYIWDALRREWGTEIAAEERARHEASGPVRRVRCPRCGLDYFAGAAAGSGDFYAALEAGGRYYESTRWEFGWTASRLPKGATVLDVGCGRGDFLALARDAGASVRGAEHNPVAREAATRRGFDVTGADLKTLSSEGLRVDVATAFHIVEHVTDPVGFVRDLVSCVREGGEVVISVPFRDRTWRDAFEVLEHPPHHLSWWGLPQLARLADAAALRWVEHAFEPLARDVHRHAVEKSLQRKVIDLIPVAGSALGAAVGWGVSRALFAPGVAQLVDAANLRARLGAKGLAVVVRLRREPR